MTSNQRHEPLNYDIGPILAHYGADTHYRRGGWQKIACPFHDDSSPSATVNYDINRFMCWVGCTDRAEDAVGLIQHIDGTDFLSAKQQAEDLAGPSQPGVQRKRRARASLFDKPWTD